MNTKQQAQQIIQKHYDIIESRLSIHGMTDLEMNSMAKEHALEEVRGIVATYSDMVLIDYYESILTEIKK